MREGFEQYADEVRRGLIEDGYSESWEDCSGFRDDYSELELPPPEFFESLLNDAPPEWGREDIREVPDESRAAALDTIAAADLQRKSIPPIRWIVNKILPAGLTILASPPKFGKSWMALALCIGVAIGGGWLGYRCLKADCLYLALEDSERRIQSRLRKLLDGAAAPEGFTIATCAPTLQNGLIDSLEDYIKSNPNTALIIVDTFQKVRNVSGGKDVYGRDYADIASLKRLADEHNIAVVVVHHLRKMADDADPFNRISGSAGISGAADAMMVLTRDKRNSDTTTLSITGRDVYEREFILDFNRSTCIWDNLGDADDLAARQARQSYSTSPIVQTIKLLLEQSKNGSWTGTSRDLMNAGEELVEATLADNPRSLTSKLLPLICLLREVDGIVYERSNNGTGGGKHKFYYANAPQYEELEQTELDPFSE